MAPRHRCSIPRTFPRYCRSVTTPRSRWGCASRTDTTGAIAGLRFYKAAGNVGTHVGTLWTSSGQELASATFVNESRSGWQTVYFAEPVSVQAGATYVASYRAPAGGYSATVGAFAEDGISTRPAQRRGRRWELHVRSWLPVHKFVDELLRRRHLRGRPERARAQHSDLGDATGRRCRRGTVNARERRAVPDSVRCADDRGVGRERPDRGIGDLAAGHRQRDLHPD